MMLDRILQRTVEEGECLLWQGPLREGSPLVHTPTGYRTVRRLVWETLHGPIEPGLYATCRCRESACVRPEHIELLTTAQIARVAAREGKFVSKRAASPLTPELVERIRAADNGAAIARELGICKSTVSKIRRGESWRPIGAASAFGSWVSTGRTA